MTLYIYSLGELCALLPTSAKGVKFGELDDP